VPQALSNDVEMTLKNEVTSVFRVVKPNDPGSLAPDEFHSG
jgi:hypothetical protein